MAQHAAGAGAGGGLGIAAMAAGNPSQLRDFILGAAAAQRITMGAEPP